MITLKEKFASFLENSLKQPHQYLNWFFFKKNLHEVIRKIVFVIEKA